jgi:hypothetical protein
LSRRNRAIPAAPAPALARYRLEGVPVNPTAVDEVFSLPANGRAPSPRRPDLEDYLYLVAGTPFEQYRDFLLKEVPDSEPNRLQRIAEQWRAASVYLLQLRLTEPAWADHPEIRPLPPQLEPLADQVRSDPIFPKAFRLPVKIGLVDLDRLVVRQEVLNLVQVERLKQRLGPAPDARQVFQTCLPVDHRAVSHHVQAVSSDTYVFTSESNDIRFLESVVLEPGQVPNLVSHGPIVGVLGILVGFGANYLSAIAAEGRIVLNNGTHRAYALRDLGVKEVPCLIQQAATRRELKSVAVGNLRKRADLYLKDPRPPVLKDYFDPRLYQRIRVPPVQRQVKIRFTVESYDVVKK